DRDREDPLLESDASAARTGRATLGTTPRGRAAAVAVLAVDHLLVADLLLAPERGLLERDADLDSDVAFVAFAHAEDAEQVAENAVDRDVADVDHPARER